MTLVVVLLTLLAFGVRTWQLEAKGLWYDESLSLLRAQLNVPAILSNQITFPGITTIDLHPPLYFLLLHGLIRLAGQSDFVLRFPSVMWAVLLVPLLYAAGARFWNPRAGVLAALLGALSPFYLWYAQEVRMYTMATALGLLAVYAFDRAAEERHAGWLALAGLATLAAAYTHYFALTLIGVLGIYALLAALRLGQRWRITVLLALAGVLFASLPVSLYALHRLTMGLEAERHFLPLYQILRDALHAFDTGLTLNLWTYWPFDLIFLAFFLVGALWPDERRRAPLMLIYLFVPVLAIFVASLLKPTYGGSRYVMIASPPYYLLVARGLERTSRGRFLWPVAALAGLALATPMVMASYNYFTDPHYAVKQDYRRAAATVQSQERPGDAIVINGPENATAFMHYYTGSLPIIALPKVALSGNEDKAASDRDTAAVAARYERVWLVKCQTQFSDPHGYVERWLEGNMLRVQHASYSGLGSDVLVQLYMTHDPRLQQTPPVQHALQVNYGALSLEGYDLPLHAVAGGERAWVTFYWRVQQPGANAKMSLRLLDTQGRQWAQTDEIPYPDFPPKHWPVGSVMRYDASIVVPMGLPAGWYRLELRLYDADSKRPIEPLQGAEAGALPLGSIRVTPTMAGEAALKKIAPGNALTLVRGGMRFDDLMTLVAYRPTQQTLRPGEWLHVDLYWQVEQQAEQDLTLNLDLVDQNGQVVGSYTGPPVSSLYPATAWQPGELLWGQHDLLFPTALQPGDYTLRASVRDAQGRLLAIRDRWRFWTWGDDTVTLARIQVAAVPRVFTLPAMQHTLERQSSGGIDLLGFDNAPAQVSPGQALDPTLYWRAAAVPDKSYKVSVQLIGADQKTLLAQEDSVPVNWTRPTTGWALGEIISDTHHLTVDQGVAPQQATLIVALYDEDTGKRVEWFESGKLQDHVVLGQVQVKK